MLEQPARLFLTNHIAIAFPPLLLLDTHNGVFRRHSAASNSVNPGSFSKWRPANTDDERVSKFQLQGLSQKTRYAFS